MVFDSLYKHFNNNDQSNTVYNKGDDKTQTGLRKHSFGNQGGSGGSGNDNMKSQVEKMGKMDKDDINTDEVKKQAGKMYEQYSKDN